MLLLVPKTAVGTQSFFPILDEAQRMNSENRDQKHVDQFTQNTKGSVSI